MNVAGANVRKQDCFKQQAWGGGGVRKINHTKIKVLNTETFFLLVDLVTKFDSLYVCPQSTDEIRGLCCSHDRKQQAMS